MIWPIEVAIMLLVVICGIGAITVKDLLGASILFGAYSFMMCLLWAISYDNLTFMLFYPRSETCTKTSIHNSMRSGGAGNEHKHDNQKNFQAGQQ